MIFHKADDNGILFVFLKGDINLDDILDFLTKFKSFDHLPNDIKLLYDFLEADLDLKADQIKDIASLADEITEKYLTVKTAFVVNEPIVTAFSYLFSSMDENPNRERKVFSTNSAAIKWLLEEDK